jgi:hypothetical protein
MQTTTARLRSLCDLIIQVYGHNSLTSFSFLKAMESLERVRFELQSQAQQDCPGHANEAFYR